MTRDEALRTMHTALTAVVNLLNPAQDSYDTRLHLVKRAVDIAERAMAATNDVADDAGREDGHAA
jgi:hypothetical protein